MRPPVPPEAVPQEDAKDWIQLNRRAQMLPPASLSPLPELPPIQARPSISTRDPRTGQSFLQPPQRTPYVNRTRPAVEADMRPPKVQRGLMADEEEMIREAEVADAVQRARDLATHTAATDDYAEREAMISAAQQRIRDAVEDAAFRAEAEIADAAQRAQDVATHIDATREAAERAALVAEGQRRIQAAVAGAGTDEDWIDANIVEPMRSDKFFKMNVGQLKDIIKTLKSKYNENMTYSDPKSVLQSKIMDFIARKRPELGLGMLRTPPA